MKHRAPAATVLPAALLCLLAAFGSLAGTGCMAGSSGSLNRVGPVASAVVSRPASSNGLLVSPPPPVAARPSEAAADAAADAVLPVPVVELRGTAADLGTAHGRRLAGPINLLYEKYLGAMLHNPVQRFVALTAAGRYESLLLPDHRAEVAALAKQVHMDEREMALAQCFLDLMPVTACSTVALPASASPDGVARFGRNLDFDSLDVADRYSTLFVYHPEGRYAFVSVGWPGLIGVLSGMNEHGLTVANMEVDRRPRLPTAMPYTLLYRTVLERCRTTDEAIELLRNTPRQTANNLMIVDAAGNRAVAEITPEGVTVRRGEASAALISTNHQRGGNQDSPGRCDRYDCLHDESKRDFGRIDEARVEKMLADASPGRMTLQAMVFEPANRVIYLSAGANAANGVFHRVELKKYFGEHPLISSSRPAPTTARP